MKKIISIISCILMVATLLCGCGEKTVDNIDSKTSSLETSGQVSTFEESLDFETSGQVPTFEESLDFIKNRYYNENTWTEVSETSFIGPNKEVITATPSIGSIVCRANGVVTSIYYDDFDFEKICSQGDDIASAWKDISAFYEDFSGFELELTCIELESNMQEYESATKYTIYKYEHNRFSYTVTVNQSGVYIEAKPTF